MHRRISIFSFFSGVGILDLAFEKNGYDIVLVNECDEVFLDSYKYVRERLHLKKPIYGYDNSSAERYVQKRGKRKLIAWIEEERSKGNLVGFIGGPPCPDFSVAGKNAGSNGAQIPNKSASQRTALYRTAHPKTHRKKAFPVPAMRMYRAAENRAFSACGLKLQSSKSLFRDRLALPHPLGNVNATV